MFNVGGGEFLIIFLVALVVLGPTKLPEVARQVGKVVGEFRRISSGFQREIQSAMNDPVAKATGQTGSASSKPTTDVTRIAQPGDIAGGTPSSSSDVAPPATPAKPAPGDPDAPMFGDR